MSKETYTLTAESVRRGHPDKLCDQIADGILDAYLRRDPDARVAVEVMVSNGRITIAGEVSAGAELLEERVMCDTIQSIFDKIEELRDQIEEVQNEEQEAYDNLPEGLQNSERGEAMSEAIYALETAYSSIEDALGSLEEAMQ